MSVIVVMPSGWSSEGCQVKPQDLQRFFDPLFASTIKFPVSVSFNGSEFCRAYFKRLKTSYGELRGEKVERREIKPMIH